MIEYPRRDYSLTGIAFKGCIQGLNTRGIGLATSFRYQSDLTRSLNTSSLLLNSSALLWIKTKRVYGFDAITGPNRLQGPFQRQ